MMRCGFCQETFNCIDKWVKHIEIEIKVISTINSRGPFRCPSCYHEYNSLETLSNHLKNRKCYSYNSNQYSCLICNSSFVSEANLLRHTHFGICVQKKTEQSYRCANCFTNFTLLCNLRKHQRLGICNSRLSIVDSKVYEDMMRSTAQQFNAPTTLPIDPSNVKPVAQKGPPITRIKEIKLLSLSQNVNPSYSLINIYNHSNRACPRCSKVLKSKNSWLYHVSNVACVSTHDITDELLNTPGAQELLKLYDPKWRLCPICFRVLNNKHNWIYHVLNAICIGKNNAAHQIKPNLNRQCKFCCKLFASSASTRKHETTTCRFRIKVYKCDWCDQSFSRRIEMVKHLKAIDCVIDPMVKFGTYFSLDTNIEPIDDITNNFFDNATNAANTTSITIKNELDFISNMVESIDYASLTDLDHILIDWQDQDHPGETMMI